MRWVISLLMQFGQGLNALHFNLRLALFGGVICIIHTVAALVLLCERLIPASTAEQIIDFSMSGTVFLLVGVTVSAFIPAAKQTMKGNIHDDSAVPAAQSPEDHQILVDRAARFAGAVLGRISELEDARPGTAE